MASRDDLSDRDIAEQQQKANRFSHHSGRANNGSSRAFGGSRTGDHYGSTYDRAPSRSPEPYRARRGARTPSRSPSPYRAGKGQSGGGGRNNNNNNARFHNKRKASSPPHGRPDKKPYNDRKGYNDTRSDARYNDSRAERRRGSYDERDPYHERKAGQPMSYETDNPPTIPDFRDHSRSTNKSLPQHSSYHERSQDAGSRNGRKNGEVDTKSQDSSTSRISTDGDVQMTQAPEDSDLLFEPAPKPVKESREEKLRRWAAIRAASEKEKPKENLLHKALLANAAESPAPSLASPMDSPSSPFGSPAAVESPGAGDLDSVPASPDVMVIDKPGASSQPDSPGDSFSAANYDPTQDMLDDRDRAAHKARQTEVSSGAYDETDPKFLSTLPAEKIGPVKKQKKDFDMFDFDDDENEDEDGDHVEEQAGPIAKGKVLDQKLLDNWDDVEGYYKLIANELVNAGRYRIIKELGRGVFANVAQAEDTMQQEGNKHRLVAIKMVRKNDLMRLESQKEIDFIKKLNKEDPQNKRHILSLLTSFDHKGHLCAVFELMSKNLRDLLKEHNGHGLALPAVRSYSRQMFVGLQHLIECQIVHRDLKPDNILVSPDNKTIKLCDFGTAIDKRDQDIADPTEYLVSRFYRAPEIILGLDVGYGIDMWAVACTIYELWTGKILFTGLTNNQMIKAFINCLGWPTEKLLKKGLMQNIMEHFEAGPPLKFISQEVGLNGKITIRKIEQQKKIARGLKERIKDATRTMTADDLPAEREIIDFVELLTACLNFNPEKRMQPKAALAQKFFPQPKPVVMPAAKQPALVKRPMSTFKR